MYFPVFHLLIFFGAKFVPDTFWSIISATDSENKHIYTKYYTRFELILYSNFFEPFAVRRARTKVYVTSELCLQMLHVWCQNVLETEKIHSISHWELCTLLSYRAKGWSGPKSPPPPRVFFRVNLSRWQCIRQKELKVKYNHVWRELTIVQSTLPKSNLFGRKK